MLQIMMTMTVMMITMLLTILISLEMHLLHGGGQMPWRTIGANPDNDHNENDDGNNNNDNGNNDDDNNDDDEQQLKIKRGWVKIYITINQVEEKNVQLTSCLQPLLVALLSWVVADKSLDEKNSKE